MSTTSTTTVNEEENQINTKELDNKKSINSIVENCMNRLSPEAKNLARKLIENGVIIITDSTTTKEDIERDFQYLEEAITISNKEDGLRYQIINYNDYDGGKVVPIIDTHTAGQAVFGTTHDPIEIFKRLKESYENKIKAERKKQEDLKRAAIKDWQNYKNKGTEYDYNNTR